jgi:hypothetical protein
MDLVAIIGFRVMASAHFAAVRLVVPRRCPVPLPASIA